MKILYRDGKRMEVLRPTDPEAAIKHAEKCLRKRRWSNYPGETKFVGYLSESEEPCVLNENGEKIGEVQRGDVFATSN